MKRFILHSDLNNFYASVECLINPKIKNDAVIVCGDASKRHGVVLAKNYVAKKFGIKTGDTILEAENKVAGKVKVTKIKARLDLYQKVSYRVQEIYTKYTDYVEMFGIDEAWLDITPTTKDYSEALEIADMIRKEVKERIGLTVSIGVSFNKIFAKLGSDLKKPDAITLITKGNYKDRIHPLSVNNLLFVGKQTTKKLQKLNINTIGDLAIADKKLLEKYFGVIGIKLWEYANGLDLSPVKLYATKDDIKSIGNSITWHRDLCNMEDVSMVFYTLAEQVAYRIKRANLYCNEIQIFVKDNNLHSYEHQCKLPYPTNTSYDIAKESIKLFERTCNLDIPKRALGIRLKDFSDNLQTSIFDAGKNVIKNETIDNTMTKIRNKYGDKAIVRGNTLWES